MDSPRSSIDGCIEACERMRSLVRALPDEAYTQGIPGHSPLGAHARHCVDHFRCFLRGLPRVKIDYDERDRDPAIERSRPALEAALEEIEGRLRAIPPESLLDPLLVVHAASSRALRPAPSLSTVYRELLFLSSHTIHHVALMRVLSSLAGHGIDAALGEAYSTSAYSEARLPENGRPD